MSAARPVRYGLIGFGAWGSHHARAITECPGAELVAIAARSEASQEAARVAHPGIEVLGDFRQLLKRPDIDVVDVVLPTDLHHEVGLAVLAAGKHLLLEKPMALCEAHCDDLIRAAEHAERLLCVGHEFRLSSLWGKVKDMVDAGAIGEPQYALIELWRRPYRQGSGGWRYDVNRVGSWILEEPIHFFDLARWYFSSVGNPARVAARAKARDAARPELLDNFSAFVDFPGGGYAVISQTLSAFEHHQVVKLTGSTGALWATWSGAMDRTFHPTYGLKHFDGETIHEVPIEKPTGEVYELVEQIDSMTRAVRDGAPVHCTGKDGKWSVAMCLRAAEAVASGSNAGLGDLA
ncbi:MAG: gfo/Idh/MocA family oxidoreductase [Candidatus Hydrogenedens sp.]|nr:gfo/Idh/MocA family oxidoreductase [Candidatus Hydrogenedens sp.]